MARDIIFETIETKTDLIIMNEIENILERKLKFPELQFIVEVDFIE